MTSREEQTALTGLTRLLASDLSKASDEDLIAGIRQAETVNEAAPEWSGRFLAALHHAGKSWPQIARLTGIKQTTAYRRAQKYL